MDSIAAQFHPFGVHLYASHSRALVPHNQSLWSEYLCHPSTRALNIVLTGGWKHHLIWIGSSPELTSKLGKLAFVLWQNVVMCSLQL